jgi:hypothetical protein
MTPGVVPQNRRRRFVRRPGTEFRERRQYLPAVGSFISGNRDSGSNISFDGSNVQIPVYGQATRLQARARVQEVRVESANMSAEFGNGVAAVNVITGPVSGKR